ncbi:hypothetical protein JTE90_027331 [Oedothorax gibbosus]|uniref:Ileal sodium/bile acid cotransporter n=1 Tax=Oedothorax gibbosus TaxID=931172 RepID=A0AAV6W4E5_9ARAC|nr:hypothetical protein JTE90_027331 [Oedothorax gibbosus]
MTEIRPFTLFPVDKLKDLTSTPTNQIEDFLRNLSISSINDSTGDKISTFENEDGTLQAALHYVMFLMLICIMLGMGCEITLNQLWGHIKRPIGLGIGIVSQFGIKPVAAFAVLLASGVAGIHATGVLIIACCPGGPLSNTFTYFSDGDLPLSVAMTTASTLVAMGMLPANIWLYGRHFESVDLVIPYQKMAVSLLVVTSPICVGMIIRWKIPKIAKWVTKTATSMGLLLMIVGCILEVIIFPNLFTSVPTILYVILLLLPILGLALGYGIATIFRQKVPVCKTIAIECGIQNFPLALTIIALSFPQEMQKDIVLLPWLYGFAMIVGSIILCGIYQLHKRFNQSRNIEDNRLPNGKRDAEDPENNELLKTKNQHIELKPQTICLNGNGPRNV